MAVDVLLLGFNRLLYAGGDVGMQGGTVSGVPYLLFVSLLLIHIHIFYFYFTRWRAANSLLLSHPATCVDMAGWTFLLFGSTVAICVFTGV